MEAAGCFCVRTVGQRSFSIGQKHGKDILLAIRSYVGTRANVLSRAREPFFFCFETYSRESHLRLIAHFEAYPLLGEKAEQLNIFVTPALRV